LVNLTSTANAFNALNHAALEVAGATVSAFGFGTIMSAGNSRVVPMK
jgi:hypothetical protein